MFTIMFLFMKQPLYKESMETRLLIKVLLEYRIFCVNVICLNYRLVFISLVCVVWPFVNFNKVI